MEMVVYVLVIILGLTALAIILGWITERLLLLFDFRKPKL